MLKNFLLLLFIFNASFVLWPADLDTILETESLSAGIRKISSATYLGEEFSNKGFCYDIVNAFAEDLGVSLDIRLVDHFSHYWIKDGEIIFKAEKAATPDIYNEIDIAADIITVSELRKKYVNMVPFVESTEIFAGKKDLNINSYDDLSGLRILTLESLSFFKLIQEELSSRKISYVLNPVGIDDAGDMVFLSDRTDPPLDGVEILFIPSNTPYPKFAVYTQILLDHADLTIQDSFSFFLHYSSSMAFRDGLRTMFPLGREIGSLAFCTSYETPELNRELKDFINRFKKTDKYEEIFMQYMGISSEDYHDLLSITRKGHY